MKVQITLALLLLVSCVRGEKDEKDKEKEKDKENDKEVKNEIWDCFNSSQDSTSIRFTETSVDPAPIKFPGKLIISSTVDIREDLPEENLFVKIEIVRSKTPKVKVPCIDDKGSCKYDVCNFWMPRYADKFCKFGICSCPIKKGTYYIKDLEFNVPKLASLSIINSMLSARYSVEITIYNSESKRTYGKVCGMVKLKQDKD